MNGAVSGEPFGVREKVPLLDGLGLNVTLPPGVVGGPKPVSVTVAVQLVV
jgi:hypothetical protein